MALALGLLKVRRMAAPLLRWLKEGRRAEHALDAWRTAVALPRDYVWRSGWLPFVMIAVPLSIVIPLMLDLPVWSAAIVFAGALVAVAYAAVLHFSPRRSSSARSSRTSRASFRPTSAGSRPGCRCAGSCSRRCRSST